ncbi:hypothetical protein JCGZ_05751 [Jatropha curcas]|uniref:Uncharacterized protein n=1 Tax=Jatropha curcas TaxID=180498 RepID=A0A067L3Z5_JATCU|nr:hypothetical protein JCGZ_05751 [Jatropha curcas]
MHNWIKSLFKVEKINLGRYGLSPIATLRGVVIDWDFLQACIRFWDPEAHVFRFGAMMEKMCPLIGDIVLAETIQSIDRAALGFDNWTVSPIILQDHLQVVAAPTFLPYNPSQYRCGGS